MYPPILIMHTINGIIVDRVTSGTFKLKITRSNLEALYP
jgi:hypothetical protein